MKVLSAPEKVTLNITNRCNLNCLYCSVSPTKNDPEDLTITEWKNVIDELAEMKVFNLLISGGEPFMRQDFVNILKHIFRYHFRISINTNGTIFNEEVLSVLSGSNRLDNVQVSLDGPDSEVHDFIRGRGTFEKTIGFMETLHRREIPFNIFVVVCRTNKDHLKKIVHLAKKLGVAQVTFSSLLPQGSALAHLDDLFLSFKEQKKVEEELRHLKKKHPKLVGGSLMQAIQRMDWISQINISKEKSVKPNKITSCGGSVSECSIRPEGWVIPCDRLWEYKVGNVKQASLKSIWLHSEGFQQFRKRYTRNIDSFKECHGCGYTGICAGGCPSIPYNMGRGIEGWDPLSCFRVFTGELKGYI